jgi:4-amino-4-deoxy-L-arabinose transferase-like glycosyltransferase
MAPSAVQAGKEPGKGTIASHLACLVLLLIHGALAVHSLRQHCVTVDEGGHVLSGLLAWEEGRVDVYPVNPPLVKTLVSLPLVASRPELPEGVRWTVSRDSVPQHRHFMQANQECYLDLLFRARYVLVALSILGGWLVYRWSSQLFGPGAGLVALALWALCPNVLCWSGVCTVDLGAGVFAVVAMYALRGYLHHPDWLAASWAGSMLGLALLTKFTLLMLYPVCLLLGFAAWWQTRRARPQSERLTRWLHLGVVFLTSVLVINAGYGFQGIGRHLGDFEFRCQALTCAVGDTRVNRFRDTWLEQLPVPLPEMFVLGLDEQKSHPERLFPAYLRGQWQEQGGWWYYYLYVLVVKLPLGTWLLGGLTVLLACANPRYRAPACEEWLLWLPAAAIFVLVSSQTGLNLYGSPRYVLPAFPFLFLGISRVGLALEDGCKLLKRAEKFSHSRVVLCAAAVVVLAALSWNAVSVLRIHPHYLSYFNEVAGGPDHGWEHLIESNIDWGQDLLFLKQWSEEHPEARPLRLAYYGGMDAHLIGLEPHQAPYGPDADSGPTVPEQQGPQPGWYAVSVNLLCGMAWRAYDKRGQRTYHPRNAYSYFRLFRPVAKAGYSIFIYHITPEEANRVRAQFGLPPLPS